MAQDVFNALISGLLNAHVAFKFFVANDFDSGYRSKLAISLGLIIISFTIFFLEDMFVEENMQEDAEQKLEELLEQNFPSK